jgi:hypothetical protein
VCPGLNCIALCQVALDVDSFKVVLRVVDVFGADSFKVIISADCFKVVLGADSFKFIISADCCKVVLGADSFKVITSLAATMVRWC